MKLSKFDRISIMEQEALALLREHFGLSCAGPHAVMLTGGRTPLRLYKSLEDSPGHVDDCLHLLISDERHVPSDSPENNYARMRAMIAAMGLDDSRMMRVRTELPLGTAADRYHHELASFIDSGGRITLGILGLGADGHVASLFDAEDISRGEGRYAVAVPRKNGPDRVSVTRDLLLKVQRLLLLAAGAEKTQIVERMAANAENLAAWRAVQGVCKVELWFSN